MPNLPILSGKELISLLQKLGFDIIRIKGSHYRLKHNDGRVTTVPLHGNRDLPKGLLDSIIKDDLNYSIEEFKKIINNN